MSITDPTLERCEAEITRLRAWLNRISYVAHCAADKGCPNDFVEVEKMVQSALSPEGAEVEFPRRKTGDEMIRIGIWPVKGKNYTYPA